MNYECIAPCHFGLEAILKREIQDLGYEVTEVEDGRVTFLCDEAGIARANIFIRTAERIMIKCAKFTAVTFDELFEKTKSIHWEQYIPVSGKFWVSKASSTKSKLFSASDIQKIVKKAMVERLKSKYHVSWFEENGDAYPVRVFILKDSVTIGLDTTGESLHRRGYRQITGRAPLTETLAAAIIKLTPWNGDRILVDPFCGSGTILIEAAMMAANMAPGLNREYLSENWTGFLPKSIWMDSVNEANDLVNDDIETDIQGYDIDGKVIRSAKENAAMAGVDHLIHFQERPVSQLSHRKKYGFVITNPPYGERLEEKESLPELYRETGRVLQQLDSWSYFILTAYEDAQKHLGKKADKNRKIYNGMMKTYFYQYYGPKPPRKTT